MKAGGELHPCCGGAASTVVMVSELTPSTSCSSSAAAVCPDASSSSLLLLGLRFAARCLGSKVAERIGARLGTGAAVFLLLLGETDALASSLAADAASLKVEEGDESFVMAVVSLVVLRFTALGLDAADSVMISEVFDLVARSLPQVRDPGRPMDQAEPSCGKSGEGVKMAALEVASLASRAVALRPGVVTFEAEAVVTASPSMVDGGRTFQTLDGLPEDAVPVGSVQASWSILDMVVAERCGASGLRLATRLSAGVKEGTAPVLTLPLTLRLAAGRKWVDAEVEDEEEAGAREGGGC